jgi:mono/diheme cytochrome c family protein
MFLLPFFDRNPRRHWKQRKLALAIMGLVVLGMVGLTVRAVATTPAQEEAAVATSVADQVIAGQDLYSIHCVECHGADGEGGEIQGVEGLEGVVLKPINSQDEMYTRTDETLYNIIAYGQQDLGMPPFSKAFGGELSTGEIEYIVTFMRYTWDDRVELPQEAAQPAVPALGADEVPSYEVHIQPIVKRYCISCHRPGKKNNNYFMATYNEIMKSGDNAPNVIPGDLSSNLIRMINREEIEAGGPMPPTKALPPELVEIFTRWVKAGAPNTAADAAALQPTAPAEPTPTLAP